MVVFRGFDTDKDVPDLSGKVILLTGGTGGIGKQAILHLASHNPSHILFTGRNEAAATSLIASCPSARLTFVPCDLASLASVAEAGEKILALTNRLDVVVANAGIMAVPAGTTQDGYEIQFGTNHLGNAALVLHVLPLMLRTAEQPGADVRFVALTSLGAILHPRDDGIKFASLRSSQEGVVAMGTWGGTGSRSWRIFCSRGSWDGGTRASRAWWCIRGW